MLRSSGRQLRLITVDSLITENARAHENRDFGRFSDFKLARKYVSGG